PSQCSADGGAQKPASRSLTLGSSPSSGGSRKTVSSSRQSTSRHTMARRSPRNRAQGLRSNRLPSMALPLSIAYSGVGQSIGQIQQQVGQEHRQGNHHR